MRIEPGWITASIAFLGMVSTAIWAWHNREMRIEIYGSEVKQLRELFETLEQRIERMETIIDRRHLRD